MLSNEHLNGCHDVCRRLNDERRCVSGNHLELLNSGEQYVPAMLDAIWSSNRSVDLELYRVDPGKLWHRFSEALGSAASRGICVRLLVDSFGSRRMSLTDWETVRRTGVRVAMTPSLFESLLLARSTCRDHRKLLLVDNEIAFTGGMSIDDTFFHPSNEPTWRESMVQVRGPLVTSMMHAFDEAWANLTGGPRASNDASLPLKSAGPTKAGLILSTAMEPRGELLFSAALSGARKSAFITNPFVVPSKNVREEFVRAAHRGIDVRLLVPGRHHRFAWVRDAMRGFYSELLQAGIRIFEYEAAMLHAKTVVVDESWASVGSFNLDPRSFVFNDEIAVASCDALFARAVADAFAADCRQAHEVTIQQWRERGTLQRCREIAIIPLRRYL